MRELDTRGIRVVVGDERLSLRGSAYLLTPELTAHLRQHKAAILEVVRRYPTCCECGAAMFEPTAWWGGEPVHRDCGEAAWRREWQGKAASAD